MLDLAIAFVASNIWTIGFLVAAIYNHFLRPEHKPITQMAMLTALIFAVAHIAYTQWVALAPHPTEVHYLYLASSALILAIALYFHNKSQGFIFYWPLKLAIGLMLLEVVLTLLVHVDRNIFALNGESQPNFFREASWWLWEIRTTLSHVNNVVILASLFLPVSLLSKLKNLNDDDTTNAEVDTRSNNVIELNQPKPLRMVQLSTLNGYRNIPADIYIKEVDQAYSRVEAIQDLIDAMSEGEAKETAKQFAYTASELITRHDQSKVDYLHSIHLLCNKARDCALYMTDEDSDPKIEVHKNNGEQRV